MAGLVVYTEDSPERGAVVVRALAERILLHLSRRHSLPRIDVAHGEPANAANGLRWRARDGRERRILVRDLATRLAQGALVVFHYDGDVPWTDEATSSRHDDAFAGLLADVARLMAGPLPSEPLTFVPHYSIEAWLYLHEKVVAELVSDNRAPQATEPWMTANRRPETGFDHVDGPKDTCPLGDRFNGDLARNFPVPRCINQSPSLRRTVDAWAARGDLRALLGIAD